jgi:hypothetical protein
MIDEFCALVNTRDCGSPVLSMYPSILSPCSGVFSFPSLLQSTSDLMRFRFSYKFARHLSDERLYCIRLLPLTT